MCGRGSEAGVSAVNEKKKVLRCAKTGRNFVASQRESEGTYLVGGNETPISRLSFLCGGWRKKKRRPEPSPPTCSAPLLAFRGRP